MACPPSLEQSPRRARGFTLVELLVALVILSLLTLIMSGGLRFVFGATASTQVRRENLEELTFGMTFLRGEIGRAYPLMLKEGTKEQVLFLGEPEHLRFVTAEPGYVSRTPYMIYALDIVPTAQAYRIELRRAPLDPATLDLEAVEQATPRPVLELTQPVTFTYYGKVEGRDGKIEARDRPTWLDKWPTGANLPMAVRLAAGDEPGWPELVVDLRVRVPWYCGEGGAGGSSGQGGDSAGGGDGGGDSTGGDTVASDGAAGESATGGGTTDGSTAGGSGTGRRTLGRRSAGNGAAGGSSVPTAGCEQGS